MFTESEVPRIIPDEGITRRLMPQSLTLYTNTWYVVWYESPTGHRFVGIKGDGDALIRYLKAVNTSVSLFTLVEEKWRWLNENPMYKRAWGKLTRRELQRGLGVPDEPEHHEKLIFGQPAPKVVRKRRGKR
jgi:hypothetical protein